MDRLNKHDKRSVINCVKEHIQQNINKNIEYYKQQGIGPSKVAPFLLNKNHKLKKDINNLEEAINPGYKINVD